MNGRATAAVCVYLILTNEFLYSILLGKHLLLKKEFENHWPGPGEETGKWTGHGAAGAGWRSAPPGLHLSLPAPLTQHCRQWGLGLSPLLSTQPAGPSPTPGCLRPPRAMGSPRSDLALVGILRKGHTQAHSGGGGGVAPWGSNLGDICHGSPISTHKMRASGPGQGLGW